MHGALKLFSLYMSFDMLYIETVLGCPEKRYFLFGIFLTLLFFFPEAKQGHHISPEILLRSNAFLTLIGSEGQ